MKISANETDALRELINIGVGRAAGALNDMVGAHVQLRVPSVRLVSTDDVRELMGSIGEQKLAAVRLDFAGGIEGLLRSCFPPTAPPSLWQC